MVEPTLSSYSSSPPPSPYISNSPDLKFDKSSFIAYKTTAITKDYTLGKILGTGAFGTVRSALHKPTKQIRAVKILKKSDQDEQKLFLEVDILSKLSHPNIMKIFEFYEDKSNFYIISELCQGGELFDMITDKKCFSESEAAPIIKQLLSAICYSHKNHVVHRDLKPENILIENKQDDKHIIKLIDWGGARYFSPSTKMSKVNGTPYYIAPEVLFNTYNEKCDIWSAGVILYVLLCGYPPFNGETDKEIMEAVKNGYFDFPEEEWSVISSSAKRLIKRMLIYDFKQRPSALELLADPWFSENETKIEANKQLAKSALENMKRFKRNKQFEQATISFIVNQLTSCEDIKSLRETFTEWDKNGDGVLSKEEIMAGYQDIYGSVDEEEIDKMIKSVDLDGNGVIDYNEFLNCTINRDKIISEKNLKFAFNTFDKDGSGAISIDEIMLIFRKTATTVDKSIFEKMLKEADANGDGEIEYIEFKAIMEDFFK
jgi:calcium-dependent protein kinase